jgi:beta-mannosidase
MKITILYLVFALLVLSRAQDYTFQNINEGWRFKSTGNTTWHPATVPGTVHLDLMHTGIIGDPYYRANWLVVQWVDLLNWEYITTFNVTSEFLARDINNMVFYGLDTHATVVLNGQTILRADDMWITWTVNVSGMLNLTGNTLHITFESAPNYDAAQAQLMFPVVLPGQNPNETFSRKAQYHYGWDWGPRLCGCGIWQSIMLEGYDLAVLTDTQLLTDYLDSTVAVIVANVELNVNTPGNYTIQVTNNANQTVYASESFVVEKPMITNHSLTFNIDNPTLWWCWNLGNPYLYPISIGLFYNGTLLDTDLINYGLRTVEVIQQNDTDDNGTSFFFRLNGVNVFAKGASYIPPDMFMPRVTADIYNETIQAAIGANFNMLRVWGGGNYENDTFYNIADQYGMLLWQEFMFACGMYPGNQTFLNLLQVEFEQNVKRLRNHPSIVIWVGNNEVQEGWNDWGWQNDMTQNEINLVWSWYEEIFLQQIPAVLAAQDSTRYYWQTSPLYGYGDPRSLMYGDTHYWAVWVEQWAFETYNTNVGRFNTEYGMQGILSFNSVERFTIPSDWSINSTAMEAHERHAEGWPNIACYMQMYYANVTYDFQNYIYVTQVMQSLAIQYAIEAHRREQPHSMGSLVWQLNDVWPSISWAMRDWYGEWKAVMYMAKQNYQNAMISIVNNTNNPDVTLYEIYIISDYVTEFEGTLQIQVMDFYGNVLETQTQQMTVPQTTSTLAYTIFSDNSYNISTTMIVATLTYNFDEGIAQKTYFMARPLNLILPSPTLTLTSSSLSNSFYIKSNVLAKSLFISFKGSSAIWNQNYFDLLPGVNTLITYQLIPGSPQLNVANLLFQTLANAQTGTTPKVIIAEDFGYQIYE